MRGLKAIAAAAALLCGGAALAQGEAPAPVDYADAGNWLCLPGRADVCATPLATTALDGNGYGATDRAVPDPRAPADCFYVYPTVSRDPAMNSDLDAGPEEQGAALSQFARFGTVCRAFAPKYRQATLASIAAAFTGASTASILDLAYGDVRAAWRHYLAQENDGRPFVLIGHSQGAIHLSRLLAEEIEGTDAAKRMLSAMLIGWAVEVPEGQVVGGSFKRTPLCTARGRTGCVISYMSFRATEPPPAGSFLGRAARPGMTAACTNPAALGGGSARLDSYWFAAAPPPAGAPPVAWSSAGAPPTPFLRTEGLVSAACVNRGPVGYLSVLENAAPGDARTDRIPGDVYVAGRRLPDWGLHLADMSLAQGDLIAFVKAQAEAFAAGN